MQDQLLIDVQKLTRPGTRKVGSRGHLIARQYLSDRMAESGLIPYSGNNYELPYSQDGQIFFNLAGVLAGTDKTLAPLLLIAHYDTCGDQPGADDNAAAIAIWLAVIEQFRNATFDRTLVFLFPDAEEPPHFLAETMGSSNFYRTQLEGEIHAGLVLDLVGHDVPIAALENLLFVIGAESHPALANVLANAPAFEKLRYVPTLNRYIGDLSDYHILRENREPYLFFTCGRWEHYHQISDTPDKLNYAKMHDIAEFLIDLVQSISAVELKPEQKEFDTTHFELALIKRNLGDYLKKNGIAMENRNHIENLVQSWLNQHKL